VNLDIGTAVVDFPETEPVFVYAPAYLALHNGLLRGLRGFRSLRSLLNLRSRPAGGDIALLSRPLQQFIQRPGAILGVGTAGA
jgi:hypothetical protein